jgi:hypothetical protein
VQENPNKIAMTRLMANRFCNFIATSLDNSWDNFLIHHKGHKEKNMKKAKGSQQPHQRE